MGNHALKEKTDMWEASSGRALMGPLPDNHDLVDTISAICLKHGIGLATFSVQGNITEATIGVYDPFQQVYITARESFPGEIVHCSGWFTGGQGTHDVSASIAIADDAGNVIGGKLFSETLVLGAEIILQEWQGPDIYRQTDPTTGLAILNRT